jgi:glycosyltransferase involved in cell wall biosynthesis
LNAGLADIELLGRSMRDRLLMLAPVMPSDRGGGLAMRAGFFLDAYCRRFDVDLVVAPIAGSGEPTPFVRSRVQRLEVLKVDRADSHYELIVLVRDPASRLEAFRRYGWPSLAAFNGAACPSLERFAYGSRYAAVHVFRLYLAQLAAPWMAKNRNRTRLVLDCDENDALAYRRIAAMERDRRNFAAAGWAEAEATGFERMAAAWVPKFDLVFAASHRESNSLSNLATSIQAVPNVLAAPPPKTLSRRQRRVSTILFVGTLGYPPNVDAIMWFVSRVWPRLQRALHYRVRLAIVGRSPPEAIARLRWRRGIIVAESVPDVGCYYRDATIAIAPVDAGGGTRFKVIEAASYGVPLVTTAFGIEGTTLQGGVDVLVANDHETFLRQCLSLLRDGVRSRRLVASARRKAMRDYSPSYWRARVAGLVAGEVLR